MRGESMTFKQNSKNGLVWMTAPTIKINHAFTTRAGGISEGVYASLNLSEIMGDSEWAVRENYSRLCETCGFSLARLAVAKQVHGTEVRAVTSADSHELFDAIPYEADGLMTDEKGLALAVFTADCVPILLYDPVRGVAAAVHAGWRGTAADIAGKAVRKMGEVYGCDPGDICAAIGPSIGKCCFETDNDVPDAMRALLGAEAEKFIFPRGEKQTVNLRWINRRLLEKAGVLKKNIAVSGECTMCRHNKYWSHRYTNGQRGSMASVIML